MEVDARISVSPICDIGLSIKDQVFVIFNPDNLSSARPELLEDVQAICFHGALRKVPVVIINPCLIATAWNDYGPRSPLLLSDFAQAYFICDDLLLLSRKDEYFGIVQRASAGMDLFRLTGLFPGKKAPKSFTRIESWPDGMPDNLRSSLSKHLANDPNFPSYESLSKGSVATTATASALTANNSSYIVSSSGKQSKK